jgi:hypothetical protein
MMKIVHRFTVRLTAQQRRALDGLGAHVPGGVELPGGGDPYVAVEVDEGHQHWEELHRLFRQWDAGHFVNTEFSKGEVQQAAWLSVVPDWHHGYPQPRELDFGYLEATYDISGYCPECGVGKKQKAPFQMKGEPRWGRRAILQLNWVFDEYFVTPEVWASVFKPHGIASLPVLNTKGKELSTVVQLATGAHVKVDVSGLPFETCSTCGRVKYLPHTRGFFPTLLAEPDSSMVKTNEYFGSGASAHHGVLVSQAIVQALIKADVRGASFKPVAHG